MVLKREKDADGKWRWYEADDKPVEQAVVEEPVEKPKKQAKKKFVRRTKG